MNLKKITTLCALIVLIAGITLVAFAQEPAVTEVSGNENDTQWAWGEVTNTDILAKTFTLKYLDYEADQEKELVLTVDEKTVFENIKGLEEIKIKDTLSIDYVVSVDNKNIAKNISFEQQDPPAVDPVPAVDDANPVISEPVLVGAGQPAPAEPTPVAQGQE